MYYLHVDFHEFSELCFFNDYQDLNLLNYDNLKRNNLFVTAFRLKYKGRHYFTFVKK